MHIPDNYLSPTTCAVMGAVMVPVWKIAVEKVKNEISKKRIPLMGIGAAFTFMVMMFNIPLPGGTTGHAVGATLIALFLGPWAACISITIALLVQAVIFGDGGILAFGANCFNMAFVLPFLGYFIYKFIKDRVKTEKGEYAGVVIGSYIGINAAALCVAIEFGIQPLLFRNATGLPLYCPYPLSVSIPAMTIPHLLVVGVVEAIFTVAILTFIKNVSPGTIYEGAKQKTKAIYGLLVALICLTPLGLLATGTAWGEWKADEISNLSIGGNPLGYVPEGMKNGINFKTIMAGYFHQGFPEALVYILCAVAGTAIMIILFKVISSIKKDKAGKIIE